MKKIQDEIYDYFDNQPIPELDEKTENKFKELVARNKPKSKAKFWKKFAIISSVSVCCLLCLIIPLVILLSNPQPTTRFYTDDEAMKTQMTETEFNSFIQDNFPQYNFLIDDFDLLIGATAITYDLVLVTENIKHLARIPNIQIDCWVNR